MLEDVAKLAKQNCEDCASLQPPDRRNLPNPIELVVTRAVGGDKRSGRFRNWKRLMVIGD